MTVAESNRSGSAEFRVKDHDVKIILGYVVFTIALLIAIYAASTSPGTAPGDFVSISVFP